MGTHSGTMSVRTVAGLVLGAILMAGCSSSAGTGAPSSAAASTAATPASATAGKPDAAALAVSAAACLRQHGLDMPDPSLGPNGQLGWNVQALGKVPQSVQQAAMQACASQIAAAQSAAGPGHLAAAVDAGVKYAACMRQHGLASFPDPNPANGFFTGSAGLKANGIDPQSPEFQAANRACATFRAAWGAAAGQVGG